MESTQKPLTLGVYRGTPKQTGSLKDRALKPYLLPGEVLSWSGRGPQETGTSWALEGGIALSLSFTSIAALLAGFTILLTTPFGVALLVWLPAVFAAALSWWLIRYRSTLRRSEPVLYGISNRRALRVEDHGGRFLSILKPGLVSQSSRLVHPAVPEVLDGMSPGLERLGFQGLSDVAVCALRTLARHSPGSPSDLQISEFDENVAFETCLKQMLKPGEEILWSKGPTRNERFSSWPKRALFAITTERVLSFEEGRCLDLALSDIGAIESKSRNGIGDVRISITPELPVRLSLSFSGIAHPHHLHRDLLGLVSNR